MTRAAPFAVAAVAVLLALALAAELAIPEPGAGARGGPAPSGAVPVAARQAGTAPDAHRAEAWVTTILARPLMDPQRRAPRADAVAAADPATQAPSSLPRLSGVMIAPSGSSAIFANPGGKSVVLGVGGRIGGYTVKAIDLDAVRIEGPEGVKSLRPAFDRAGQRPGPPANPSGPGTPPPLPRNDTRADPPGLFAPSNGASRVRTV